MNSRFGAGLMDGEAMIDLVTDKDWTTVPEKHICTNDVQDVNPNTVPQSVTSLFVSNVCSCECSDYIISDTCIIDNVYYQINS